MGTNRDKLIGFLVIALIAVSGFWWSDHKSLADQVSISNSENASSTVALEKVNGDASLLAQGYQSWTACYESANAEQHDAWDKQCASLNYQPSCNMPKAYAYDINEKYILALQKCFGK